MLHRPTSVVRRILQFRCFNLFLCSSIWLTVSMQRGVCKSVRLSVTPTTPLKRLWAFYHRSNFSRQNFVAKFGSQFSTIISLGLHFGGDTRWDRVKNHRKCNVTTFNLEWHVDHELKDAAGCVTCTIKVVVSARRCRLFVIIWSSSRMIRLLHVLSFYVVVRRVKRVVQVQVRVQYEICSALLFTQRQEARCSE